MRERGLERIIQEVSVEIVTKAVNIDMPECKFCQSKNIVKNGVRQGTQYWLCKDCARGFVYNKALPRMKYPIEVIASGLYQYYTGTSLNKIRGHIEQHYDRKPSDSTIYGWVSRFGKVASDKAREYIPITNNTWVCDETVLRIDYAPKNKAWLIDCIDAKSRFLLATRLSNTRSAEDIKIVLEKATERAGGVIPDAVLSDGWKGYIEGVELAYGGESKHRVGTPFVSGKDSTNIIERFQGTLKERTKVMRGLKNIRTANRFLEGWLVYYNFFKPHEGLNGKTPAEVAGIKFPYNNWIDIVTSQSPSVVTKKPDSIPVRKPISIYSEKPYRKRPKLKEKRSTKAVHPAISTVCM